MHFGQTQIEDDQIEFAGGHQCGIGLAAIGDMVHGCTRSAQCAQQTIGEYLVIFSDEYAHEPSPRGFANSSISF
jgi:hypothetical protein